MINVIRLLLLIPFSLLSPFVWAYDWLEYWLFVLSIKNKPKQ